MHVLFATDFVTHDRGAHTWTISWSRLSTRRHRLHAMRFVNNPTGVNEMEMKDACGYESQMGTN